MSDQEGTIRSREAKSVVLDILKKHHVPKSLWGIKGQTLSLLVGARTVEIPIPRGLSFYGLQSAVRTLEGAIVDMERARHLRQQVDIEELLSAKPKIPEEVQ